MTIRHRVTDYAVNSSIAYSKSPALTKNRLITKNKFKVYEAKSSKKLGLFQNVNRRCIYYSVINHYLYTDIYIYIYIYIYERT